MPQLWALNGGTYFRNAGMHMNMARPEVGGFVLDCHSLHSYSLKNGCS